MKQFSLLFITIIFLICSCSFLGNQSGHVQKINADHSKGFDYDYYLFIPSKITKKSMLVIPNNSGFADDDITKHEQCVKKDIKNFGKLLAVKLQCPLLIPVFPRTQANGNVYTHALDRDTLLMDGIHYDQQLINMINNAKKIQSLSKYTFDNKIYLFGFSASGMFVNRFTLLHPEIVKAVSCGSPGGWVIAPLEKFDNVALTYPIGISDLSILAKKKIDIDTFNSVPQFYFIGANDTNDSVPFTDGYDEQQKEIVFSLFGIDLIQRFYISERIYKSLKVNAVFKVYANTGHTITDNMIDDAVKHFNAYE